MIFGLVVFAAVWGAGYYFKIPKWQRWCAIAMIIMAIIALHYILADDHPFRQAARGSARDWIALLFLGLMVAGYRFGLGKLRAKIANAEHQPRPTGIFADGEIERYARHIVLREIGGPGQKKIKQAKVLVVGAGGLGSPALLYLAAAGVGTLGIIDDDSVDETNLQRQIIHTTQGRGETKVASAAMAIQRLNPHCSVKAYHRRLTADITDAILADYDLVLDGTDNFETRYLVNAACVANKKPLVSGALSQWEGQLSVFAPALGAPCYECIFPNAPAAELAPNCAEAGVFSPLPGVIGTMMAAEALKLITGAGTSLLGRLVMYDALDATSRTMKLKSTPTCACCGTNKES